MSLAWPWVGLAELTPWLVRFAVAGALVTAFAHLLGSSLLHRLAVARVAAWRTTMVALLLVPLLSLTLPGRWTLPVGVVVSTRSTTLETVRSPAPLPAVSGAEGVAPISLEVAPSVDGLFPLAQVLSGGLPPTHRGTPPADFALSTARSTDDTRAGVLALVWVAVTTWFLIQLAAGLLALELHARRAVDVTRDVRHLLPRGLREPGRVRVLRGGPFRVPVCWGVLRPKILLPHGSRGWTAERLHAVLLHESAHVQRRDGLFLILARVACALHWPNPMAWGALRRLSVDAEAACDSAVLRAGVSPRGYARVLVEVASEAKRQRRPEAAMALALLRTGTLTWRVTRILDPRSAAPVRRWVTASAAAVLAVVTLAGATMSLEAEPSPAGDAAGAPSQPGDDREGLLGAEELVYQEPTGLRGGPPGGSPVIGEDGEAPLLPAPIAVEPPAPTQIELLGAIAQLSPSQPRLPELTLELPEIAVPGTLPIELATRRNPTIVGSLLELGSNRPVERARVLLLNERGETLAGAVTDQRGAFTITAPGPGEFLLNASALGYRETTVGVSAEDDTALRFHVEPTPLPVSGLVVERDQALVASGFFQRMRMGIGRFLGPEQIAAGQASRVSDLLLGIPRVHVQPDSDGSRIVMTDPSGPCGPHIYVDGVLVSMEGRDLDRVVPLAALDALEVYQSELQTPLQWVSPGSGACGVVVAWTKK